MKRLAIWFLYLLLGLTTFAAGYKLAWRVGPLRPVTLCEIAAAPERYVGRKVRLRVWLQRIQGKTIIAEMPKGLIIACSACGPESLEGASIMFTNVSDAEKLPVSISERGQVHPATLTEAIVSGYLTGDYVGLHCFAPKYFFERARLENIITSRTFAAETPVEEYIPELR
jgi:hypothetical protein